MEGAVQSLVTNVGLLLKDEYKRLRSVGGEIAELRDDMATMNALIHMQSQADERAVDSFVREWMKQLREVAFDADNCIDRYMYRVRSRPGVGTRAWLMHLLTTLFERHSLSTEIAALRARTATICERHARYGINLDALRNNTSLSPLLEDEARPYYDLGRRSSVVRISEDAETLATKLVMETSNDNPTEVFSIVGFGGLGKTTLAMEVCWRLEAEFPYQAMVTVSQAFEPSRDLEALLERMLRQIVTPKSDNEEEDVNQEVAVGIQDLGDYLSDKRYLIVIDDVWTIRAWEAIQSKLTTVAQSNSCGSRIIVTTRCEAVAKECCSGTNYDEYEYYIHHMQILEMQDSKKLFFVTIFGCADVCYLRELEDVMERILKRCGGVPLAIVSVANILAGHISAESKDKWERVWKGMGSVMELNPTLDSMRRIVALGYNNLPHELKGCMLYLSVFPEDYEIDKHRLLCRWIAEGLIPEKRGSTLREVAESYLEELARRNMVVPRFGFDMKVESCRVRGMHLEVTVSKSMESNFVSLLGGKYEGMSYDRIRRLSMHGGNRSSSHGIDKGRDMQQVRSLSMFGLQEGHKLLDNLDKFVLLRVLDLEGCKGVTNEHVRRACKLYLLRFLSFKDTEISEVPPHVKKLEHLQVLNVQGTRIGNGGLSDNVTRLKKLERLLFSCSAGQYRWVLPKGIGKMKVLREVVGMVRLENDVKIAQELGDLEHLQDISICVGGTISEAVLKELAKSLSKMYSLRRFFISDDNSGGNIPELLHSLPSRPPWLLRHIRISGEVPRLPDWIGALTHLVEFCISRARLDGDQLLGHLSRLPSLRRIEAGLLYCVDSKLVARADYRFPSLISLEVSACRTEEPGKFLFEEPSLMELQRFVIDVGARDDQVSIVGIECLINLEEVRLMGRKGSPALEHLLQQVKAEKSRRESQHPDRPFHIVVKYFD